MNIDDITKLDEQYFMPVFGKRLPVCFEKGEGVHLIDTEGNVYTDFLSGIATCCLGYGDDGYKQALKDTVDSLMHTSNYFYIETQSKLAKLLCEMTGMEKAFFSNSGAEAVEGAIKLARTFHFKKGAPRTEIITMKKSFHGRTVTTLAATGQEKFHEAFYPLTPTFTYVTPEDIAELEAAVTGQTAAVMIEPILGEGGVIPISSEYYQKVREVCDKHGALMIADEIQTGVGRTGEFLASPAMGAVPDVVVLAKSLGSGFPVGAFLAQGEAAQAFGPGDHGSTFGGNHLACAAAYYVVNKLRATDMMAHVKEMSEYFFAKLKELKDTHLCISEVRGRGLMIGIDFDSSVSAADVKKKLFYKGFVTATAGENVLRFLPPYVIQKQHIDRLISALEEVL